MNILHGARRHRSTLVLAGAIAVLGTGQSHASTGTPDDARSTLPHVAYASLIEQAPVLLPVPPGQSDVSDASRLMIADSSGSSGSGGGDRKLEEPKKKPTKKQQKKKAWDDFLEGVREDTKEQEKKQKSKSN